jgi:hypothetical protein
MSNDTLPNLYAITGCIVDINTLLINRGQLRKLLNVNSDSELIALLNTVTDNVEDDRDLDQDMSLNEQTL